MSDSKARYKVWKASKDSEAGFMVSPSFALMAGSQKVFITTSAEAVHISGPVSFLSSGEQMRYSALFVGQPDFLNMIPSTMMTPIAQRMPSPPVARFARIAQMMPFMMAFLVG